jgi:ankyrin repeat protein
MRYIKQFEAIDSMQLFDAVRSLDVVRITKLLKNGADVNIQNKIGRTPLIGTCNLNGFHSDRIIKVIKLLFKWGAKLDLQDSQGRTALIKAALTRKDKVVLELIELDADWAIEDNDGQDFLDYTDYKHSSLLKEKYPEKYEEYLFKKDANKYNI